MYCEVVINNPLRSCTEQIRDNTVSRRLYTVSLSLESTLKIHSKCHVFCSFPFELGKHWQVQLLGSQCDNDMWVVNVLLTSISSERRLFPIRRLCINNNVQDNWTFFSYILKRHLHVWSCHSFRCQKLPFCQFFMCSSCLKSPYWAICRNEATSSDSVVFIHLESVGF